MDQRPDPLSRSEQAYDPDGRVRPIDPSVTPADDQDAERLQEEIAHTRAEMSETIDAIQRKLSPQHLREQAQETIRDATIGKAEDMMNNASHSVRSAGSGFVDTIRENPIPAALVGAGLAWMWLNRPGAVKPTSYYRARYGVERAAHQAQDKAGEFADQTREGLEHVAHQAQDKAGEIAGQARDQAEYLGSEARYRAQQVRTNFQTMLYENPLALGAMALAVGTAVGMVLPHTRQEDEWLGAARDQFFDEARSAVEEVKERVQHVAEEARHSVAAEAKNQGLTG